MDISEQHKEFMRRAIALSRQKMGENCGGPFGAVIVKNGTVISEGWNQVTSGHDPTAHAEVVAIRSACKSLNTFSLKGCEIFTSCEPCPMCLSAIYWAHLDRIFYANSRNDAAVIGFDDDFLYQEIPLPENQRSKKSHRLLPDEAWKVFEEWTKKPDKIRY